MTDYRNLNDPMRRDMRYDAARNDSGAWGWIAGAVLLVVLLALAFGIRHTPNQAGTNPTANNTPPAANRPAPALSGPASPTFAPAPMSPIQPRPQPRP